VANVEDIVEAVERSVADESRIWVAIYCWDE
jgi:hypothetical protein